MAEAPNSAASRTQATAASRHTGRARKPDMARSTGTARPAECSSTWYNPLRQLPLHPSAMNCSRTFDSGCIASTAIRVRDDGVRPNSTAYLR